MKNKHVCKPVFVSDLTGVRGFLAFVLLGLMTARAADISTNILRVDWSGYRKDSGIAIAQEQNQLTLKWPFSKRETGSLVINLVPGRPLIETIAVGASSKAMRTIASELDPVTLLTVGERDLKNPAGWVAFFDDPMSRPHLTYAATLNLRSVRVFSAGARTTVYIGDVRAGPFQGELRLTFYRHSPLVHLETVIKTAQDGRAILYDTGFTTRSTNWQSMAWMDTENKLQRAKADRQTAAINLAVSGRTLVAESAAGSLAVFPAPHQYFYPVDEALNLKFVWYGKSYQSMVSDFGFGIRQTATNINHYIPSLLSG
jgi:hypothetical protein